MSAKKHRLRQLAQAPAVLLNQSPSSRICIQQNRYGIGDMVMLFPALHKLRKTYPDAYIAVAVPDVCKGGKSGLYASVFDLLLEPVADSIVPLDSDPDDYDHHTRVCKLKRRQRRDGTWVPRIHLLAEACGLTPDGLEMPRTVLDDMQPLILEGKHIVLHFTSHSPGRSWLKPHYVDFIKLMQDRHPDVTLVCVDRHINDRGEPVDFSEFSNCIDASESDLLTVLRYIDAADLFVGVDSGIMHLAALTDTRSYVLFGRVPPEARLDPYPNHTAIRAEELACLECWYSPCRRALACMKDLTPERVYEHIREHL